MFIRNWLVSMWRAGEVQNLAVGDRVTVEGLGNGVISGGSIHIDLDKDAPGRATHHPSERVNCAVNIQKVRRI